MAIEINWQPSRKDLRIFAVLQVVFFAICAWLFLGASTAIVVLSVSATVGVAGLALPRLIRPIYLAWMVAVFPIGWVVSHVILAAIYYFVFTPIGLVMRLFGRDAMQRKFEPDRASYWIPRPQEESTRRYFRQF